MEARVNTINKHTVISLIGPLDFNTPDLLEKDILHLLKDRESDDFILNFNNLDFVGSSGIERFLELLERMFGKNAKCIGLKREFQKCFKAFSKNKNQFRFYSSLEEAISNFELTLDPAMSNELQNTLSC